MNNSNNNIALVNILLSNFAKEAQNLVTTAQKIYDDNSNISLSQLDKFNEQWGVLKSHCSTVGIAIGGYNDKKPEYLIQKIELLVTEINKKKFETLTPVESNDINTPKSGVGDDSLSTLPLIIISLLSTVKMSVENYNEKILGECVANNSSPINDSDQDQSENSLNATTFILKDESYTNLNSNSDYSNHQLNKSSSSFNQSSSTLSCISNSILQGLENDKYSSRNSSRNSSRDSLNNEISFDNKNNNSSINNNICDNNNNNNNKNDGNTSSSAENNNNSNNDIETNENKVVINHPNANGLTYVPKPLPFGFEEEKENRTNEATDFKENKDSGATHERNNSIPNEQRSLLFRDRSSSLNYDNQNQNQTPRLRERKDSSDNNGRLLDPNESIERRGREEISQNRERFDRSKSRDRRRMDDGMRNGGGNRGRSKSRDPRRMDGNESFSSLRERSKSRDHRRKDGNDSFSSMRERSKSRDRRRKDGNESFSSMRERSKSRDRRRMDGNESFSNMRERSKSRDRRRIEEGMRGGYRDRSKSRDRRRIDGNENLNPANERRHEKESSTSSETRGKGSHRNSINLDNYKRKDSLDNQNMRKEKSMNNIKLKEETRDHSLMKSSSSDDVKERNKPSKVNVDIYPKRLDSHEKPPITQIKGDRSMTSETPGSNRNSPFISNCRTHATRTPSMEDIPSAVSVDSGTNQTPRIIPGRQRNVSNPTQPTTVNVKTPRVVNYDPASRAPRLPPQGSSNEAIKAPYSSYIENAATPYLSEPFDESNNNRNPQYMNEDTSSNSQRYKEKSRPYRQNEEYFHIRQRSDSSQDYSSLKSIKSSSAIRNMANHYNNGQEGAKNQIDNKFNNSNSISKFNHKRNYSEGSALKHRSENSSPSSGSYARYSAMSIDNARTMERLRTSVQFIKNFDKSFKPEGMDRRSYLYEDYFNRNSDGELIDLQMVLVPLNNMFEICTVDLNEPVRFGRSNVDNVENFISFRSLVISRTHAEIWSENDKIFLKDLGSNGGTFLNGVRICQYGTVCEPHEIKSGDFIQFGQDFFEGGIISPKMEIPENPKHRCVKFQVILSNSLNINLYKNCDSNSQSANPEQEELERQKRDIEQQILEQNEKLQKKMEINIVAEQVRDLYYINISGTNNKIRKALIKIDPGIELFNVDLSNWDQKTSFFSSKDKYKNNKILVHDSRPEYSETQNIEILKELPNTKVFSIKTKYSVLGTVQYTTKKKVQIVTPFGSPQFLITGDFKEHQWIILETHIDNDEHKQRCIGEAKGKEYLKKGVRDSKWEIKLEVEKSKFSQLLFSSFLFLIVTGGETN